MRWYPSRSIKLPSVSTILDATYDGFEKKKAEADVKFLDFLDGCCIVGTLFHHRAHHYLASKHHFPLPDLEDLGDDPRSLTPAEITGLARRWEMFLEWEAVRKPIPLRMEMALISKDGYAGRPDGLMVIEGKKVLLDYKTGKKLSARYTQQLMMYGKMLVEGGEDVKTAAILSVHPTQRTCRYNEVDFDFSEIPGLIATFATKLAEKLVRGELDSNQDDYRNAIAWIGKYGSFEPRNEVWHQRLAEVTRWKGVWCDMYRDSDSCAACFRNYERGEKRPPASRLCYEVPRG